MHGPAYGAQKAGVDKLAADMAVDFRETGVATVSIWMGILLTEPFRSAFDGHPTRSPRRPSTHLKSPEIRSLRHFDQCALVSRAGPRLSCPGHTVIGAEIAQRVTASRDELAGAVLAPR